MDRLIEVYVQLLTTEAGGRSSPIMLGEDFHPHYRPHLRVTDGDGTYLGVEFVDGPDRPLLPGESTYATVRLVYEPGVAYEALVPGTRFEIVEGRRVIGSGRVTRG